MVGNSLENSADTALVQFKDGLHTKCPENFSIEIDEAGAAAGTRLRKGFMIRPEEDVDGVRYNNCISNTVGDFVNMCLALAGYATEPDENGAVAIDTDKLNESAPCVFYVRDVQCTRQVVERDDGVVFVDYSFSLVVF